MSLYRKILWVVTRALVASSSNVGVDLQSKYYMGFCFVFVCGSSVTTIVVVGGSLLVGFGFCCNTPICTISLNL
jgi:hypothetical protein